MQSEHPPLNRIVALHADVQPPSYPLEADICTLGRAPVCNIVVARRVVSRLHAIIERVGLRYVLRDAGSANGTFINGHLLRNPHMLTHQDSIGLGAAGALLCFVDPDPTFVPAHRLRYDERSLTFFLGQQPLNLAPAQLRLLHHLYEHAGDVCTRESCAQAVWGRDYDPGADAESLDRTISYLRSAIRQQAPDIDLIQTRRGLGYVLIP
jgi:DNA-binding response OmpR family regulator